MEENRTIVFKIGNSKILVDLLWKDAPNICRKIWENLPIEASATLAKICNHEFMIQLPFDVPLENISEAVPGSVGWWPIRQNVNIWFGELGPTGPLGPTALFGEVKANLKSLFYEGMNCWMKPGTKVIIYKYKSSEESLNE